MRSVHLSDLNLAARTLMMVRAEERPKFIAQILDQAQTADKFRKHTGRAHLLFGNGTLAAACLNYAKHPMPNRCDKEYLASLQAVICGLMARKSYPKL